MVDDDDDEVREQARIHSRTSEFTPLARKNSKRAVRQQRGSDRYAPATIE
jgi:hypothetical protein